MKRSLLLLTLLATAFTTSIHAEDAKPKTAQEILEIVQLSYALQNHRMTGALRDDATGRQESMELTMEKRVMRFRFANPGQIIHLDMNPRPAVLYEVKSGGSQVVPASKHADYIRGMTLNYLDLSLKFLYWPNPQLLGEKRVSLQKCWLVRVTNPVAEGPYQTVDIYVHQGSGGAAKMEAYDRNGKMVKRFEVTKVQKIKGPDGREATALKEMKIETYNPFNGERKGRTYMTMDTPQQK